jgi:hypothetical protein
MTSLLNIRGSRYVDTPILVNPDGSIQVEFIDNNIPSLNPLNPRFFPKYSIVAKPMDLAAATGGSWLTYYGRFDPSTSTDTINVTAHASYWENNCPSFMRNRGAPQISGDIRFRTIHPCLTARSLNGSPVSVLFHSTISFSLNLRLIHRLLV